MEEALMAKPSTRSEKDSLGLKDIPADAYYGTQTVRRQNATILAEMLEFAMPEETRVRVSQNGRVIIPAAFRKALGIQVGDEVIICVQDGELRITTMQRRIQRAQARARRYIKHGVSLVDELLAERRKAAKAE
jgi:AbrB family looped-hinge helix DNA binding protein